jgi:hypothetical protein
MTDFTTMAAGRDLDALVAEKVMGHEVHRDVRWREPAILGPGQRIANTPMPRYSTDIAAAWAVIQKLMETHFMYSLNASHESGHWCVFYPASGSPVEGEYADTAPLAICRAALAAVEARDA